MMAEIGKLETFLTIGRDALARIGQLVFFLRSRTTSLISQNGVVAEPFLLQHQHAFHALAWFKVYELAILEIISFTETMHLNDTLSEPIELFSRIGVGELLCQFFNGISMSQSEFARLSDFGLTPDDVAAWRTPGIDMLLSTGNTTDNRARLIAHLTDDHFAGDCWDLDEEIAVIRRQVRQFVDEKISPRAQKWHLDNRYIPIELIKELGALGIFGVSIPEHFGGVGLGKVAMSVVTEELSRGYLGVGSLGTRAEIAAELILHGGSEKQKARLLPRIATGELLTTAAFTEPEAGSDLASVRTRALRTGDSYRIYGNKTWITHAARADLIVLLARTDASQMGSRDLSIFLAEKPRGDERNPFPVAGLFGNEIEVPGYRGMKEFDLSFDGFEVSADSLLGETESGAFKQLLSTFESARIQTAARAVGVTQAALELALTYAKTRTQFKKRLIEFPRISDKIVLMATEAYIARLITIAAARRKDAGQRCDLEAGAAKLYAARAAWAAADNALQIHGGHGYALASQASRLLCDARVLGIFEGTAEIQAQVIARRLLGLD